MRIGIQAYLEPRLVRMRVVDDVLHVSDVRSRVRHHRDVPLLELGPRQIAAQVGPTMEYA